MNKYFLFFLLFFLTPLTVIAQVNDEQEDEGEEIKTDVVVFNTLDEEDVERLSRIYGHQIFKSDSSRIFDASSIAKIPESYILGVGDEITLSIFGASQYDAKFKVGTEGYIQPTDLPRIFLKGLTWEKAKKLIESRFQRYYKFDPEQLALTISQPRIITVNILGEVERPGSYDLVATNTAFNALIAAGGPSETGSFRNIRIIRDQEQTELDIYEVMDKPGAQFQFYLEDNIIIQVPVAQKIVEVVGAVKRPLIYELKVDEGLSELIDYAGGLKSEAYKEVVQIERFTDNKQILIDVNLTQLLDAKEDYDLISGDLIRIKSLTKEIGGFVTVQGAVELKGKYALESTLRVSDLLRKGILKKEAKLDAAFLMRQNEDATTKLIQLNLEEILNGIGTPVDLRLKSKDRLVVYKQSRYADEYTVNVKGAVREALVDFPFDPDSTITIQKAILLAGGLKPDAADFGYLIRTKPDNQNEKEYIPVNIRAAIRNPNGALNLKLQAADELRISSQSAFTDVHEVAIKGAVRSPEVFQYDKSLKLKDLITLADGFKPEASKKIEVFRLVIQNDQPTKVVAAALEVDKDFNIISGDKDFALQPNDEVVAKTVPDYNDQAIVMIEGEVVFPGEYSLIKKNETLADIIQRAGGVTTEAFLNGLTVLRDSQVVVVTKLDQALKNKSSNYNIILKDGDVIKLPQKEDLVSIYLANTGIIDLKGDTTLKDIKISVAYEQGKSAKWYIDEFTAGFGVTADKDKVMVAYANGGVKGTKKWLGLNRYPKPEKGATISIGALPVLTEEDKELIRAKANYKDYSKLKKGVIISLDGETLKRNELQESSNDSSKKTKQKKSKND